MGKKIELNGLTHKLFSKFFYYYFVACISQERRGGQGDRRARRWPHQPAAALPGWWCWLLLGLHAGVAVLRVQSYRPDYSTGRYTLYPFPWL